MRVIPRTSRIWAAAAVPLLWCAAAEGQEAPVVAVHVPREPAVVGEPCVVRYEASWTGAAGRFEVAASLKPVPWCEATLEQARGHVDGGRNVVEYRVALVPNAAGSHETPPLRMGYRSRAEGTAGELAVEPAAIHVAEAGTGMWPVLLGAAGFVPAAVLALVYVRTRRKRAAGERKG